MITKVINIKDYRQNLTKIWKDSRRKKQRLIVTSRSKPIFEVLPLNQEYLEFGTDEIVAEERYKLAEKNFSFWKNKKDENLFDEDISL